MRIRSNISAIMASSALVVGGLVVVDGTSYAAEEFAPRGHVDSLRVVQGSGKVCKPINLTDDDTPDDQLIVSIVDNPAPGKLTLEGTHGRELCLDTSTVHPLSVVRLKVSDGKHVNLFENTIHVFAKPNAAPRGSMAPISVPVGANNGKFCQPAVLSDDDDKVEELTLGLATPVDGVSVEGHSLCVDTTRPLAKTEVILGVSDPDLDATPFRTSVRVFGVPTISFATLRAVVGEGTDNKVCVTVDVADVDDAQDTLVISKVAGPEAVSVEGRKVCVSTVRAFDMADVSLKVEDPEKHFAIVKGSAVVHGKPANSEGNALSPHQPGQDTGKESSTEDKDKKTLAKDLTKAQNSFQLHAQQGQPALAKTGSVALTLTSGALTAAALGLVVMGIRRRNAS